MAWQPSNSLERYLAWHLYLFILPVLAMGVWLSGYLALSFWLTLTIEFLLLIFSIKWIKNIKNNIFKAFDRASLHLEAINQEDFHQYAKAAFKQGKVGEFHQQLNLLSANLQQYKSRYDQHAFLVYQLISQLDTPVLVFNEKQQLNFANLAFYQLYKKPWQHYRHCLPERLHLQQTQQGWQLNLPNSSQQWQIKQSEFLDQGERHQLFIFIDIASAIRSSQLQAWQQIIRVLGHEIRNSLAPVSSLAETLADKTEDDTQKTALAVITERCQHLQQFVERYASLSKSFQLKQQWLSVEQLIKPIMSLYPDITINLEATVEKLWADQALLSQVLINLLKNAQEAKADTVTIKITKHQQQARLQVIDNGHGFSNLDNLFVPLYSTKSQGQGIGLNFCRNIIEQHQGTLTLTNNLINTDDSGKAQQNGKFKCGITVAILLPLVNLNSG